MPKQPTMRDQITELQNKLHDTERQLESQGVDLSKIKLRLSRMDVEARIIDIIEKAIEAHLMKGTSYGSQTKRTDVVTLQRVLLYVANRHGVNIEVGPIPVPEVQHWVEEPLQDEVTAESTKIININLGDNIQVPPDA